MIKKYAVIDEDNKPHFLSDNCKVEFLGNQEIVYDFDNHKKYITTKKFNPIGIIERKTFIISC